MLLPKADLGMLFIRTDYSDDDAWRVALRAAGMAYDADDFDRAGVSLPVVESHELADLLPQELVQLPREGYLSGLAVADARTMRDLTVLFVDLNEFNNQVGRTFRSIPQEVEPIVVNLSLSNMDFFEFADNADAGGVFRGFRER